MNIPDAKRNIITALTMLGSVSTTHNGSDNDDDDDMFTVEIMSNVIIHDEIPNDIMNIMTSAYNNHGIIPTTLRPHVNGGTIITYEI